MDVPPRPIRTFGRTRSRTLKPRQGARLVHLLPTIALPRVPFDPKTLAADSAEVWLEVGFGGGEHLAAQAARRPDVLMLGAEPYLNGVASALGHVEARGLGNVRIHAGDAREVMAALPDASLGRLFVLFPDPWPKARHHKRRLVDAAFVGEAARLLQGGGRLRFATDWSDYADQVLALFQTSRHFAWLARSADDWRVAPGDHVATRYEQKRLGDCAPIWLEFARRQRSISAPVSATTCGP